MKPRCLKFRLHHLIRLSCATILHKSAQVPTRQTRQMRVICTRKKIRQQDFWHNAETRLRVVLTWLYSTRGGIMLHLRARLIFYSVWFKYTEQAEISVIEMWGNAASVVWRTPMQSFWNDNRSFCTIVLMRYFSASSSWWLHKDLKQELPKPNTSSGDTLCYINCPEVWTLNGSLTVTHVES